MRHLILAVAAAVALPSLAAAQPTGVDTKELAETAAAMFRSPRDFIARAAEKMPEEHYTFRPTPEVRTFAELLGHIADGYVLVCGMATGEKPPAEIRQREKQAGSKAAAIKALADAAAVCDAAHEQLAGPRGAELTKFAGGERPRVTLLFFNASHAWEHYGNVVTYMRLKGLVPPSSEPRKPAAE
jgi:uncharacterized damage-inducible protein DinB